MVLLFVRGPVLSSDDRLLAQATATKSKRPAWGRSVYGQEAVRRKSFLRHHQRGPRGPLRRGRNVRVGGRHHGSRDRTVAGLRLRRDEQLGGGAESDRRPERARAAGTDPERERGARAFGRGWRPRRPATRRPLGSPGVLDPT